VQLFCRTAFQTKPASSASQKLAKHWMGKACSSRTIVEENLFPCGNISSNDKFSRHAYDLKTCGLYSGHTTLHVPKQRCALTSAPLAQSSNRGSPSNHISMVSIFGQSQCTFKLVFWRQNKPLNNLMSVHSMGTRHQAAHYGNDERMNIFKLELWYFVVHI
jgi:hypothetical protein